MRPWFPLALVMVACRSAPSAAPVVEPVPAPPPATGPASCDPPAPAPGEELTIKLDEPAVSASGLTVLLASRGHAHSADGDDGSVSFYELSLTRGADTHRVSYDFTDGIWYLEGIAHGFLYQVRLLDEGGPSVLTTEAQQARNAQRRVTLTPTDAVELSRDEAQERGREIAERCAELRGCAGSLSSSGLESPGTLSFGVFDETETGDILVRCSYLVGVYSGTVYVRGGP